ncbi:MAG: hypothetical protein ACRDBG_25700 [Waterburya sp.]
MSILNPPARAAFFNKRTFSLRIIGSGIIQSPFEKITTVDMQDATFLEQTNPTVHHGGSSFYAAGSYIAGSAGAIRRMLIRPDLSTIDTTLDIGRVDLLFKFRNVLNQLPIDWSVHQPIAANADWVANFDAAVGAAAVGAECSYNLKRQAPAANWVNGSGANNPGLGSPTAVGPSLARFAYAAGAEDGDELNISVVADLTNMLTLNTGFLIKSFDEIPLTNASVYGVKSSGGVNNVPKARVYANAPLGVSRAFTMTARERYGVYFYKPDQSDAKEISLNQMQFSQQDNLGNNIKVWLPDGMLLDVEGWSN